MDKRPLFIGIGGAGCSIAKRVHAAIGGRLARVNAAENILPPWPAESTFALQVTRLSIRSGRDTAQAVEAQRGRLAELVEGAPQVILFTGMGGATGSGTTPVIVHLAVQGGCSVSLFATLPLAIETRASAVAEKSIAAIRAVCPAIGLHDHESASCDRTNASLSMEALLALSVSAAVKYMRDMVEATT